ncbi:uncharacterized protein GGS22DRAFT_174962 [Annulohypoxylon maeteangense]|uniref:uncharacterized protein n=1 Tax=Annulohypoxylon maeteangense TaxID=1927788 RepID=UPI0020089305|nr:uncharacterized protein GGS22DRAFT_174962 [Annulohypoxylon maeteangense]KAI0880477.1 hypothetical protein GGS22DRAFT_174962 [Annulohypoxylon maeteangense]
MEKHMTFVPVRLSEVQQEIERQGAANPYTPKEFDTSSYASEDAPGMRLPSELPYSYKRWLAIYIGNRSLRNSDLQVVSIPNSQIRFLLGVASTSVPRGKINEEYRSDLNDKILPLFIDLKFPEKGLFMRIESCSANDAVQINPGGALHTVDQAITQLLTSKKVFDALMSSRFQERTERLYYYGSPVLPERRHASFERTISRREPLEIFFLPFDDRIKPERIYRVFCPPGWRFRKWRPQMTAISQKYWKQPWICSSGITKTQMMERARRIVKGCDDARKLILEHIDVDDKLDLCLLHQGLVLDVFIDEESDTSFIIKMKVFGMMSSCGSCLFEWGRDREILNREGKDDVREFRVTW